MSASHGPADAFSLTMGSRRGRAQGAADFTETPLSLAARVSLKRILLDVNEGVPHEAFRLLRESAVNCLSVDASAHPGLAELRHAVAERAAREAVTTFKAVTADYLHLTGVRPRTSRSLLVSGLNNQLHVWRMGGAWGDIEDACRTAQYSTQWQLLCGMTADDRSLRLRHADRGSWVAPTDFGFVRCRQCEQVLHALAGAVKGSILTAELSETADAMPLSSNWERSLDAGERPYSLTSAIEAEVRWLLGRISHRETSAASLNEGELRRQASFAYCDALQNLVRCQVKTSQRLAFSRVLAHPRRLFCDTVRAHALTPALLSGSAKVKGGSLFDHWAPTPSTLPCTTRQMHSRCADAADYLEDRLYYYGAGTPARDAPRRYPADPDFDAPASSPARARGAENYRVGVASLTYPPTKAS